MGRGEVCLEMYKIKLFRPFFNGLFPFPSCSPDEKSIGKIYEIP